MLGWLIGLLISSSALGQGVDHWRIGNPYVSRCDAAFSFSADYAALISNRQILFEPMVNVEHLRSSTAVLPANLFPSPHDARPVSAALETDEQTFLLFKGNMYVPMDKATLQAKGKVASWTGWPGYWKNDIDAALRWPDGAYVFIKGLQYVSYDPRSGTTSRTGQLNQWAGWPSSWTGSIEAAFNGQDGYLYFIRQGEILAMDATTMAMAPGYPRRLAGEKSGVNMAGTDAWNLQPEPTTTQAAGGTAVVDASGWCSVGIPDASTAPAGGNITPMKTDLAGGKGGEDFSDKLVRGTRVKEVRVWALNMIQAIEIVTESPEKFITEGGPKGSALGSPKVFELAAGECIIGIEGTWGGPSGEFIHTLRFITNKRKSPLYGGLAGRTGEKEFRFEVPPEGAFSGFHGRSSRYLDALGIQYNIYQYVVFDADGKLIETAGNKTAWNSGTQVQNQQADSTQGPEDPWFDDHLDVTETNKQEGLRFTNMPGTEAVGRSVDITKIDPWDLSVEDGRANNSPLVIISDGNSRGSGSQNWFFPYGYNRNTSGQLASGRSKESIKIMKSFKEYTEEFGIQVGAEFQVTGVAAGSANVSHKKRRTTAIGKTKVMISKTYDIFSHSCKVDLDWVDKKSGQKKRQKLDFTFREMVKALEVPSGKVPDAKIEDLVQNGALPSGLDRIKGPYNALIAEFGTHFINNIQFGGYYTMWSELEEDEISTSKMTETDVKVSFSAGANASPGGVPNSGGVTIINNIPGQGPEKIPGTSGGAGGSVGVNASSSQSASETNSTLEIEINASGGGGKIIYAAWEADVQDDPVVRDAQFCPISDLLSPVFFPFDAQIEKKAQMLRLAIKQHIRNSAEILTHSDLDSITFSVQADKDQAATAQQAADLEKPVKLEVELMKMKCSEGDGDNLRKNDKLELYGNMELSIVDDQLNEVTRYTTLDRPSNEFYLLNKDDKYQDLNELFTVTTTKGKLDDLKIVVWGNVYEEDAGDADDDLLEISSFADGQQEGLPRSEGIGKHSEVKTISVTGVDNVRFTLMVRVKWIE
ncbi:MAG: hypothetical protein IT225_00005 [Flavobacteriales bacterium]|nr:hypothetical protein [Flavobacteriales bacterium]